MGFGDGRWEKRDATSNVWNTIQKRRGRGKLEKPSTSLKAYNCFHEFGEEEGHTGGTCEKGVQLLKRNSV